MGIVSILMTGLWVLLSGALGVVFVVKYRASPTGILGAIGSTGHALMVIAFAAVPRVLTPAQMQMAFGLMNGLSLVASRLVFVAVLLAPVPSRQGSAPVAPPWTPPHLP